MGGRDDMKEQKQDPLTFSSGPTLSRVEVKPIVLEPPKMEAEKELEIVTELINNCEADLKVKDCDEKALTMTLLSLKKRRANAKVLPLTVLGHHRL
jgi:hypothetical protein